LPRNFFTPLPLNPKRDSYAFPTGVLLGKATQFVISSETSSLQSRYIKFYKCKQLAQFYISIAVFSVWAVQSFTEKIYKYNFGDFLCFIIIALNLTIGLGLFWTILPVTMNDPSPNSEDCVKLAEFRESVSRIFDVIKVKEFSVLSHTGDHFWLQLRLLVKDTDGINGKKFFFFGLAFGVFGLVRRGGLVKLCGLLRKFFGI
jgi:hypothetical protein